MSHVQKIGLITCIPKQDKPKQIKKNWQPITVMNCTYEIAAGFIANIIKTVLDKHL